tara:strand:- start:4937 stop:5155 length:219 start_codon:yes stop_codon:yes gene_type:complete
MTTTIPAVPVKETVEATPVSTINKSMAWFKRQKNAVLVESIGEFKGELQSLRERQVVLISLAGVLFTLQLLF